MERENTHQAAGRGWRWLVLLALAGSVGVSSSCVWDPTNPGGTTGYVPLDQADATLTIRQAGDSDLAVVTAQITGRLGLPLILQDGQAIAVNGELLSGPAPDGVYTCEVPVADEYTVTVSEPTRGVLETTVGSPAAFTIMAPLDGGPASLSGFTLTWSNPDAELTVMVTLTQTPFGEETTQELGPVADEGSWAFEFEDLADFRQGAPLLIGVTRTSATAALAGFDTGTLSVEHSESITAEPGP